MSGPDLPPIQAQAPPPPVGHVQPPAAGPRKSKAKIVLPIIGGLIALAAVWFLVINAGPTEEEKRAAVEAKADLAAAVSCDSNLSGLINSLDNIDEELSNKVTFGEYARLKSSAGSAYDAVDKRALGKSRTCLSIGVDVEKALNNYTQALNVWSDCIDDFYCQTDSVEPTMQRKWADAATRVKGASDRLDEWQASASEKVRTTQEAFE